MSWVVRVTLLHFVSTSAWFKDLALTPSSICGLTPPGHLYPFGYHKQPLPDMDIVPNTISTEQFNKIYMQQESYRPGIFRGLQNTAKCSQYWDDAYLDKHFGHYKVLTEVKHELRQTFGKELNTLSNFLLEYNTTNQYVVTVLPDDMRHQVHMPQLLQCGTFSQNLLELNLWMGSGDTASQIHYDADHNIHCLIAGKKSFFMIHPDQHSKLHMERLEHTGSNYCPYTNQNKVDLLKEPGLLDVDYQWDILYPGDCIFIPAQYTHQVRSYGRSISVTILWDPTIPLDIHSVIGCTTNSTASIADFNVAWSHKADDIFLDVGYATPHIMRQELVYIWEMWHQHIQQASEDVTAGWTYEQFVSIMFEQIKWGLPRCKYTEIWVILIGYGLDTDHNGQISPSELETSSDDLMKAVSHFVDSPNLNDERYDFCEQKSYYVPPEAITEAEQKEIARVGSVVEWLQLKGYKPTVKISDILADFLESLRDFIQ